MWDIWAKVKCFLILSYLYLPLLYPGNALPRVQRVHKSVDLLDITFCTRRFWSPELSFIEQNAPSDQNSQRMPWISKQIQGSRYRERFYFFSVGRNITHLNDYLHFFQLPFVQLRMLYFFFSSLINVGPVFLFFLEKRTIVSLSTIRIVFLLIGASNFCVSRVKLYPNYWLQILHPYRIRNQVITEKVQFFHIFQLKNVT